jgi:hypothetical protein
MKPLGGNAEHRPNDHRANAQTARHPLGDTMDTDKLLKALMAPGDMQLPAGDGMNPPVQETLEDMLPDLPSITDNEKA